MQIQTTAVRPHFEARLSLVQVKEKVAKQLDKQNVPVSSIFEAPEKNELWVFVPEAKDLEKAKAAVKALSGAIKDKKDNALVVNAYRVTFWVNTKMELF